MKFLCGSCRTKYQISDDKVRGKILTIRCKKCGAKVMVKESLARQGGIAIAPLAEEDRAVEVQARAAVGEARAKTSNPLASAFEVAMGASTDDMPTSIAPVPANQDDAGVEWYVAIDGAQHGPFAYAELIRKIKAKDLIGKHYAWHDGMDGWKRIRDVPDFAPYLVDKGAKKTPPPPPPSEIPSLLEEANKVVDFAQKRAERDRRSGAPAADSGEVEGPTHAENITPVRSHASDRVEQLDSVLNEALGIRGEGATAQASPKHTPPASVFSSPAGIAPPMGGPPSDFSDFGGAPSGGSGGHLPADLFDNVPRASAQELVNREQTRFFVAAAGVDQKKSRNKMGLATGAAIAISIGTFFVLWASGIIQINIPGLGNPFAPIGRPDLATLGNGEVSPEDLKEIKRILSEREYVELSKRKNGIRDFMRSHRRALPGGKFEYVQDAPGGQGPNGPRGDQGAQKIDMGGDGIGLNDVPDSRPIAQAMPGEAAPLIERPDGAPFDDKIVARRINEVGKKAVSDCYRRELMGNQNLGGKLEVLMTLQPTGEVSRATVETPTFKGTQLGECIAKRLRDLRFPAFSGETHQFVVPFVLDSGQKLQLKQN
jgi:predicted Zn finger-like uncharacterized protein